MPIETQFIEIRHISLLLGLCLASGLVSCSGNSPSTSTNGNSAEDIDSNTDAGPVEELDSGLISTTTLKNSGFRNVIPLLEAQVSMNVSEEFIYIEDHALSPDGSGFAIAITENRIFIPPPNPKGDRIEIYNTGTGQLVQTLGYTESLGAFGKLFWSTSGRIHYFYGSSPSGSEPSEHWVSWNANTGAIVQEQSIFLNEPCDNWGGMYYDVFHSSSDTVIFLEKNDENIQSHLCRLNLSDSTASSVVINYSVLGGPLVSPDGSITAVMQATYPDSPASIERTHTYDTFSFLYRDEIYENEGFPKSFGPEFRVAQYGNSHLQLLPSNERLDMGVREVKVSETGTLLSAKNPESHDYVRFVALPEGIVIGDVEETGSWGAYTRRISRDGEVAIIARRQRESENYRFDIYDLSSRTNYTALTP